jgi:hypothetical protein
MTEQLWNTLTPQQQANHCWTVLSSMLKSAVEGVRWKEGNEHTLVVSGLTSIVARRTAS